MWIDNSTLWLAGIVLAAAIVAYSRASDSRAMKQARRFVYGHLGLLTIAIGLLLYLFLTGQYQYSYVARHSSRSLELFYKISALWAGQEGTILLWAWITAIMAVCVSRRKGELQRWAMVYLLATQVFMMVLLYVRSPFALVPGAPPADGNGLNILLKDPWMVIHPPIVFIGYAAFAIPFAYVLAALTTKNYKPLATAMFPYAAFATATLGVGIFVGGYWAYKVLGWGGYWAWDPVENASLIPWLTGMALLHALLLYRMKGSLPKATMWLACVSYILVVYGTFLTRSGVLADFSVHSFADEGINAYLTGYMFIVAHASFILLLVRARGISGPPIPKPLSSREFGLTTGIILFCMIALFVLIGTSFPILSGLTGQATTVKISYYNQVALPIGLLMALVLGLSPFLMIERTRWEELLRSVIVSLTGAVAITIVAVLFWSLETLHAVLLFAALMALLSNTIAIIRFSRGRFLRMAGHLTHLGFALMVIGILASSAYSDDVRFALKTGESTEAYGERITFAGSSDGSGSEERLLNLILVRGKDTTLAHAKSQVSNYTGQVMLKPYIEKGFFHDVYISPLEFRPAQAHRHTITLIKNEPYNYNGWDLTFTAFDMAPHGSSDVMRVGGVIDVGRDGQTTQIIPAMETGAQGRRSVPVHVPGTRLSFSLIGISVEQKSVTLEVDDPETAHAAGMVESLALSVARKPLTSLVWIGCVLISVGTLLSYRKRRLEENLIALAGGDQSHGAVSASRHARKAAVPHYQS